MMERTLNKFGYVFSRNEGARLYRAHPNFEYLASKLGFDCANLVKKINMHYLNNGIGSTYNADLRDEFNLKVFMAKHNLEVNTPYGANLPNAQAEHFLSFYITDEFEIRYVGKLTYSLIDMLSKIKFTSLLKHFAGFNNMHIYHLAIAADGTIAYFDGKPF